MVYVEVPVTREALDSRDVIVVVDVQRVVALIGAVSAVAA